MNHPRIVPLTGIAIRREDGVWPIPPDLKAGIESHWEKLVAANPRLWNGRVLGTVAPGYPKGLAVENGVLVGTAIESDYASFLAWRDWGFPEIGIRNLFGSALIMSCDGALIYGVMGTQTANAGRVYPPGGSLEPRDVRADGFVDVIGSIEKELNEETGLEAQEALAGDLIALFDGPRVAIARIYRFAEESIVLAARIRAHLTKELESELADFAIIRSAAALDAARTPEFARLLAQHALSTEMGT